MFEEFLMPLDRQFDSGFGATADSFHDAAKAIDSDQHKHGFGLNCSRLPIFYLYRHACELYFKSILTILHRRFCSTFPSVSKDDFPTIDVEGKLKRIFTVHSLLDLYRQFRSMLRNSAAQISQVSQSDWSCLPTELDAWIDLIHDADKSSTMFRYPITLDPTNDAQKSSFKSIKPSEAIAEAQRRTANGMTGVKLFALKDDDGALVEAFIFDNDAMSHVLDALKQVAELLSGVQFGMRHEFLRSR